MQNAFPERLNLECNCFRLEMDLTEQWTSCLLSLYRAEQQKSTDYQIAASTANQWLPVWIPEQWLCSRQSHHNRKSERPARHWSTQDNRCAMTNVVMYGSRG